MCRRTLRTFGTEEGVATTILEEDLLDHSRWDFSQLREGWSARLDAPLGRTRELLEDIEDRLLALDHRVGDGTSVCFFLVADELNKLNPCITGFPFLQSPEG